MRKGFSLVELSIVLVILGLLVGGVLSGQSLIHAAELRAVTQEYSKYVAATNTFKDKYFALPGDMANATSFWGVAGGTGSDATCNTTASTDAKTCNGNGDGNVSTSTGSQESFRFWQHLANAGLIEGQYNGIIMAPLPYVPGTNMPRSKLTQGDWSAGTQTGTIAPNIYQFEITFGNQFGYSNNYAATGYGALSPSDAWNIDTKLDDGLPAGGRMLASWGTAYSQSATACTTAASSSTFSATYLLSNNNKDCVVWFKNAY